MTLAAGALPLALSNAAHAGDYPYTNESLLDSSDVANGVMPQFGDLDQDGDQDIVLVGYYSLWWYENTGGLGSDMVEVNIDPELQGATDAVIADIDGDGDPDIVASGDGLRWYENVQNAATFVAHPIDDDDSIGGDLEVGDINGDGNLDVMIAETFTDELHWYEHPGADADEWGAVKVIPSDLSSPDTILLADFDGDGRADLLAVDNYNGNMRMLKFEDGPWSEEAMDIGTGIVKMRAVDLDDDGDLDVLRGEERRAVIMRNLGDGLFGLEEIENSDNIIVGYRLDVGDVDGDGDDDLIGSAYEPAVRWWPNEGGEYGEAQTILEDLTDTTGMDVADVDCDGDADVMVHGYTTSFRVTLFTNETFEANGDECSAEPPGDSGEPPADDGDSGDETGAAADETGGDDGDDDGGTTGEPAGDDGTGGGDGAAADDDDAGGFCSVDPHRGAPLGTLALFLFAAIGYRRRSAA